jgi:HTH-type transcriptional regulator / antitoxin HigA
MTGSIEPEFIMKKSGIKKDAGGVADDYLELVKQFPLRPLRSDGEYDRAIEIHRELISRADSPGLSTGETDYADALTRFIGDYENQHYPRGAKPTPIELLKFLMEENSMNTSDLGVLLGSGRGQASMILNGKRELSKANIRTLGERFKLNPGLFL